MDTKGCVLKYFPDVGENNSAQRCQSIRIHVNFSCDIQLYEPDSSYEIHSRGGEVVASAD
jgi:hypothetical protein